MEKPDHPTPGHLYARRRDETRTGSASSAADFRLFRFSIIGFIALAATFLGVGMRLKLPLWPVVLPLAGAVICGFRMHRARKELFRWDSLGRYYETGLARLARDWDTLDEGAEFADGRHPYANDLSLFGRGSLFQLLCSARTHCGRETLAEWMKNSAGAEEIILRQQAVAELRADADLRERLASVGAALISDCKPETFHNWLFEKRLFPSWLAIVACILPLTLPVVFVLWSLRIMDPSGLGPTLLAWAVLQGIFGAVLQRRVRYVIDSVALPSLELPLICDLLALVAGARFSSPKLVEIATRLQPAEPCLRKLRTLVTLLDQRIRREWFLPLSYFLLWGTQFALAIERWRLREGDGVPAWLAAIGEFEALICLATYSFEHPGDPYPEVIEGSGEVLAQGMGHPFLDEHTIVRNDLTLDDRVRFLVVSGSNMSGKSTFLRALGLNTVLAYMGAPVRCGRLVLPVMKVAAAMRIEDDITSGKSRFYAEMLRLKQMIEWSAREPLLFLIDEIMSGTNSHDRRIASEWVVQALISNGAVGLISTHDLSLTQIPSSDLPGSNVHFRDSGKDGELQFDYQLYPGVLKESNALNIAHLLGITGVSEAVP